MCKNAMQKSSVKTFYKIIRFSSEFGIYLFAMQFLHYVLTDKFPLEMLLMVGDIYRSNEL